MMMKYVFPTLFLITLFLVAFAGSVQARDVDIQDVPQAEQAAPASDITEVTIGNLWELTEQAGPIRYAIYFVLMAGIFLISLKTIELMLDQKRATQIETLSFRKLDMEDIVMNVAKQTEHMSSRIMATMLNVFQTNKNPDNLHDEIASYNKYQQDNFTTFRSRVDFLSDTAGALGLLGTVWGMFMVFSTGIQEKELILVGMGIALLTTLLGLIVSIILNFSSTLTQGYFAKRLNHVTSKADELRFRLMELSDSGEAGHIDVDKLAAAATAKSPRMQEIPDIPTNNLPAKVSVPDKIKTPAVEKKAPNFPDSITLEAPLKHYQPGAVVRNIGILVMGTAGKPVAGSPVKVELADNSGTLDDGQLSAAISTDDDGIAKFDWHLDNHAGEYSARVTSLDKNSTSTPLQIITRVVAVEVHELLLRNNNQGGVAGGELKKPLIVVVKDPYDNPVADADITFRVTMGNGKLENGEKELLKKSEPDGTCRVGFYLDEEPGFNAVEVSHEKSGQKQVFQAMGQEVTV